MKRTILSFLFPGIGLFVAGPIVRVLLLQLTPTHGADSTTALLATSPFFGLIILFAALILALGLAAVAHIVVGERVALMSAGLTLAWGAWAYPRLDELVRFFQSSSPLRSLAAECVIIGLAIWAGIAGLEFASRKTKWFKEVSVRVAVRDGLTATAMAVAAGGVVAAVVARSEMVGQTFAAAAAAGLVGTLAARLVVPEAGLSWMLLAIPILGLIGQVWGIVAGGQAIESVVYQGLIPGLTRPMPLDWAAGFLVGCPVGASWAGSMVTKQKSAEPAAAA